MRTLSIMLLMVVIFSCKKEGSQSSEEPKTEAEYKAFLSQKLTRMPELSAGLKAAANPGFATWKEAYEYYTTSKIVGQSGTSTTKIDKAKSSPENARTNNGENIWYQLAICYTGTSIGGAAAPTYIYVNFGVAPFVQYAVRTYPNGDKEYYAYQVVSLNWENLSYLLSGPGTISPVGSADMGSTMVSQRIQHEYTIGGIPWSRAINYYTSCQAFATLPTMYDPPETLQLQYGASGWYF